MLVVVGSGVAGGMSLSAGVSLFMVGVIASVTGGIGVEVAERDGGLDGGGGGGGGGASKPKSLSEKKEKQIRFYKNKIIASA